MSSAHAVSSVITVRRALLFFALFFHLFLFFCSISCAADQPVAGILPPSGFLNGWNVDGKPATYTRDTLYTYIDGEAELYMPYGFSALASAMYATQENPDTGLVADIFRMGSALDAFGIFSYYRDPDAERVAMGAGGFVDESQLMFYKDRYFVRLSSSGNNPERTVFLACADAIARKIPGSPAPPAELSLIRLPSIVPGTEKYTAQSVLGYAFFKKGLTAEGTLSGRPVKVFVILDKSAKDAANTFNRYFAYLREKGGKPQLNKGSKGTVTLAGRDPLYKGVLVRRSGRHVFGIMGLQSP